MKPIEEYHFKKFDKSQRSTFAYWFYHWKAFNLTAMSLGAWKFKYLFHDFEKPWLRLFLPYEKVQRFHRKHSRHHLEYKHAPMYISNTLWAKTYNEDGTECYEGKDFDWEAMVIDWECSRHTKIASPRTALEEIEWKYDRYELSKYERDALVFTAKTILGLTK